MITKQTLCFIILLFLIISCKNKDSGPETSSHKCYPLKCLHNLGINSSDEFRYDENNNVVDHYHSGYISEHFKYKYNLKQQIIQSVYHTGSTTEIIDTSFYTYRNDTLIKIETLHYTEATYSAPKFGNKYVELFDYKLNGNLVKISKTVDDQIQGYVERYYENNNLISIRSFDSNNNETGDLGFEYDAKENSMSIAYSGYTVEKIWYDDKNSPVKCLNIFSPNNQRILFDDGLSQLTYTGTGFLQSDHNPVMIVQATDTVRYTYDYNEFDFPVVSYISDSHNHQFSYNCDEN